MTATATTAPDVQQPDTPLFTRTEHLDGKVTLYGGDNRDVLRSLPDNSIDSICTDPPYALVSIVKRFGKPGSAPVKVDDAGASNDLKAAYARASAGFMGKQWDTGEVAFSEVFWAECLRVLKPGGHVVAFSGTRTYHRMAVAIEDAGFEIRDQLAWAYGSGFPKSHDVSKGIDKAAGAVRAKKRYEATSRIGGANTVGGDNKGAGRPWIEAAKERGYHEVADDNPVTEAARQWQGWGTALKPAWEPICLARKPLCGTVAANVLEHGTDAINIAATRVGDSGGTRAVGKGKDSAGVYGNGLNSTPSESIDAGRWPANIVHDGSDEVLAAFPETAPAKASNRGDLGKGPFSDISGRGTLEGTDGLRGHSDTGGSAARFFYTAKADKLDRIGSKHPTVKPVDLMQWLCRLVTPPGGIVLDPFAGSGSTGEAAWREGFRCVLVEREEEYQADIAERLRLANAGPATRKARAVKQVANDNLPLFSQEVA